MSRRGLSRRRHESTSRDEDTATSDLSTHARCPARNAPPGHGPPGRSRPNAADLAGHARERLYYQTDRQVANSRPVLSAMLLIPTAEVPHPIVHVTVPDPHGV